MSPWRTFPEGPSTVSLPPSVAGEMCSTHFGISLKGLFSFFLPHRNKNQNKKTPSLSSSSSLLSMAGSEGVALCEESFALAVSEELHTFQAHLAELELKYSLRGSPKAGQE